MSHTYELAKILGERLKELSLSLGTAESCTSGWIAKVITDVPGSSTYYKGGFIVYSNECKHKFLGVPIEILRQFGAVSRETASHMVLGTMKHIPCDVAIITTGIAGPSGGTKKKPVGTVLIGIGYKDNVHVKHFLFNGNRESIRLQTVITSLQLCIEILAKEKKQ